MKRLALIIIIILAAGRIYSADTLHVSDAALFLSKYVAIPSVSGTEEIAANWFAEEFIKRDFYVEFITNSPGSVNFVASLYPLSFGKPNIVFLNHMDVVEAGDPAKWKYPPYGGVIAEDKVWGRGSFDNKGLGVIQMFAVSHFLDLAAGQDLDYNVSVLCVSGEETGGKKGSAIVAKEYIDKLNPVVVIGEGGSGMEKLSFIGKDEPIFGISIAEKGCMVVKLSWSNTDVGHASIICQPYANLIMINTLYKLLNAQFPAIMTKEAALMFSSLGKEVGGVKGRVMEKPHSKLFQRAIKKEAKESPELNELLSNKITLTDIVSEKSSYNQVTQEVSAILDCRLLPGQDYEDILEFIRINTMDSLMTVSVIERGVAPLSTDPEYFFDLIAESLKKEFGASTVVPMLLPASTDNSYFRTVGIPTYGINPMIVSAGQLAAIHNYDEFIKLEDIDRGINTFVDFLKKVLDVY